MLLIFAVAAWIGVGVIYFTNPGKRPSLFSDGAKALTDAVNNNRPEDIRQMTATGVNPNAVMLDGTTVLHAACGMGKVECVKALLDGGADVHIADAKGRTPLHFVAEFGMSSDAQKDITTLLLQAGANPNAKDAEGNTPLAVATRSGNSACAQVLQNQLSPASAPHE
jgi:cytohesin